MLADGSQFNGPVDQTSGMREVGNTVKNVVFIRAVRDVWKNLISSLFDSIDAGTAAGVAESEINAGVIEKGIEADVATTAILNPPVE